MKQSSFPDACPKLEESNRIDPAVGTLLYLGECYERTGRTASAWATFREAASLANTSGQADRARVASSRAQEIEPKLSRLSVELAPEVARLSGVVVKRGPQRIEPQLYGVPLPVDPGEYRIEVSAPGYETWSTPISVAAGGASASVRVPGLVKAADAPAPVGPTAAAAATQEQPQTSPASSDAKSQGLTTQQTLGLVSAGVGVVGVGVGTFFGIRAISRNNKAEDHCPKGDLCNDQEGVDLTNRAHKDATIANIGFIAGGVLLATGAVLYFTGGPKTGDSVALVPVLAPGTAAASVTGRF